MKVILYHLYTFNLHIFFYCINTVQVTEAEEKQEQDSLTEGFTEDRELAGDREAKEGKDSSR